MERADHWVEYDKIRAKRKDPAPGRIDASIHAGLLADSLITAITIRPWEQLPGVSRIDRTIPRLVSDASVRFPRIRSPTFGSELNFAPISLQHAAPPGVYIAANTK